MAKLKRFKCVRCASVVLVTGGQSRFRCVPCRAAEGETHEQRLQLAAHAAVAVAIRAGVLPHPSACKCADCGSAAGEYDHRDYRKPLEVDAVCRRCNHARGPAIGSPSRRASAQHVPPLPP